MECNKGEAFRCILRSILHLNNKDFERALKFSVKAKKLFPSIITKWFMESASFLLKRSKRRSMNNNKKLLGVSYNSESSRFPSRNNCTTPVFKPKHKTGSSLTSSTKYSFMMCDKVTKYEFYKCFKIAVKYTKSKKFELAEKYALKSKKLCSLPKVDELLKIIQKYKDIKKALPTYTEEQANLVKKVKQSKDHYTMLGIERTASIGEIRRAYKKLALLLHPDKNSAPGSGEGFTIVSNAVNVLCDITKRNAYDKKLRKCTKSRDFTKPYYHQPSNSRDTYDEWRMNHQKNRDVNRGTNNRMNHTVNRKKHRQRNHWRRTT